MANFLKQLLSDESGFVVSSELVLVGTIAVTGTLVGLVEVRNSAVNELNDLGDSLENLNQSYCYGGLAGCRSATAGSQFIDQVDVIEESDLNVIYEQPSEQTSVEGSSAIEQSGPIRFPTPIRTLPPTPEYIQIDRVPTAEITDSI
ncbi:branched-chain amino acid aminotransferase [Thalassoglobus sp. JC818]|uniref:branched-chain amino acid aminotransferase n=1 Tax=Thalassoglobus sp. JC818 TaxID=3232136 RepID=UPI0034581E39